MGMKTKLVIFGITGDLSHRKLLPALSEIAATGEYDNVSIIGVSRRDVDVAEMLASVGAEVLADRTTMFTMDLADAAAYEGLRDYLDLEDDEQALIYLSVPPSASADIVDFLGHAGLNTHNVKILFEKPFGFDLTSAQEFIERTAEHFNEEQLYRIDHYMAKEVAQEIVRLRSNAENKHHSWSNQSVASIEVVASEKIGVEDRAVFYEQTGALRDFVQGHLMQLLSLVLMDIPHGFSLEYLPEQRLRALESIVLADTPAVRAQYEGYQEAVGNIGSLTETFTSIALVSNDERWRGVPFTLTTGKALNEKRTYVKVTYTDGTEDILEEGEIKSDSRLPDAYERVLIEAVNGRKSIFTTGPEVLRSWEILAPVQEVWNMDNDQLKIYPQGSSISEVVS